MLGSNHWTAGDFSDMGLKMAQLEAGCNNVRSLRMTTSKSFQEKKIRLPKRKKNQENNFKTTTKNPTPAEQRQPN